MLALNRTHRSYGLIQPVSWQKRKYDWLALTSLPTIWAPTQLLNRLVDVCAVLLLIHKPGVAKAVGSTWSEFAIAILDCFLDPDLVCWGAVRSIGDGINSSTKFIERQ